MPEPDAFALLVIASGLILGGLLKGATGVGLPIIAIPVIASVTDIRFAVILLAAPNFFSNAWQIIQYRRCALTNSLSLNFAMAGTIGAVIGTVFLACVPLFILTLTAVSVVLIYILLRLLKPDYQLPLQTAKRWAVPVGVFAGSLQGAIGLSAPVSITFLHSIRLKRETFIYTMSVFFAMMAILQVPVQIILGLSTAKFAALSNLALLPILVGLYAGNIAGKKVNPKTLDLIIMGLLVTVSVKMLFDIAAV